MAKYGFFLVFEDRQGNRKYTLPEENKGPLMSRLLVPNLDGVIRIGPTPVHPSRGALVINAWGPPESNLPDLRGRCSYVGCNCGTLEFRVDYVADLGQETTQRSSGSSEGSPTWTDTHSSTIASEVGASFEGLGGKVSSNSLWGWSTTSASYSTNTGESTSVTRPVVFVRRISIKEISSPPEL